MAIIIFISSLCRAASTDFPDPLSSPVSIVHHSREVFQATPYISTELLYIGSSWSSYLSSSMWRGPQMYNTYEFVLTSAVSRMSGSSNFDSFRDENDINTRLAKAWTANDSLILYKNI